MLSNANLYSGWIINSLSMSWTNNIFRLRTSMAEALSEEAMDIINVKRGICMKRTAIALLILSLCLSTAAAETVPTTEPPSVTKVVLYKHGMGYLEREGKIKDNAMLSLAFRAEQMKDLLTSFFAVDLGGGRISAVRYETRDPLSKQLEDILIKVPEKAALSEFLMQLKGARLKAKAAGETVEGRILGVEPMTEVVNNQVVNKSYRLVLLTEAGPIRSLDLFAVSGILSCRRGAPARPSTIAGSIARQQVHQPQEAHVERHG